MRAIIDRLTREPVILINIVKAFLVVLVAFGVYVSPDQSNAVVEFLVALTAIFGVGAAAERQLVTPVAAPQLPKETIVGVTDEAGKVVQEKEL